MDVSNRTKCSIIKKYLSDQYHPAGLLDVDYNGKNNGTITEEILIVFLRLITNSRPEKGNQPRNDIPS